MSSYYWEGKAKRAVAASKHTELMKQQFPEEIADCVKNTALYQDPLEIKSVRHQTDPIEMKLVGTDSVNAIFSYAEGKTAVLNFASFKNPGGMFIMGSQAQEESLCHASFLYNVLQEFNGSYYEFNRSHLNNALYMNRALYSPDVVFLKDRKQIKCDVITCAAPNLMGALRTKRVSFEENSKTLESRCRFVIQIAELQQVDTLILGAFGCGVFAQNPTEVAEYLISALKQYGTGIKKAVFAIPNMFHKENYEAFEEVFKKYSVK